MATWLKQSTAVDIPLGPFLDETDGKTAETGLTLSQADIRLKKNNGSWAQKNQSSSATHEENGWYEISLDTTDTNTLGVLLIAVHEAGALPVWREFLVVPANVWDSYLGADLLQVDVTQYGNANGTFSSGRPEVNTTHAAGTAWGSGAITAGVIATDAIGAAELATDAITEIADAVAAEVWAATTRTLSALDEDSTTIDLDAAIRAAIGLATANLDTQLAAIDDYIDTEITAIAAAIAALNNLSASQVKAEIVDALSTDTYSEPGQGTPAATASLATKIGFLYKAWRNKKTQTASGYALFADDTTTVDQKAAVSDDGTTLTVGETATGP